MDMHCDTKYYLLFLCVSCLWLCAARSRNTNRKIRSINVSDTHAARRAGCLGLIHASASNGDIELLQDGTLELESINTIALSVWKEKTGIQASIQNTHKEMDLNVYDFCHFSIIVFFLPLPGDGHVIRGSDLHRYWVWYGQPDLRFTTRVRGGICR